MATTVDAVQQQLIALRDDRAHGASFLAQRAVWALARTASVEGATEESVAAAAAALARVRPFMSSVANSVQLLLARLQEAGWDLQRAPALAADVIAESQRRAQEAARRAAALLPLGGMVLTCSHSSTVVQTLAAAGQQKRGIRVQVLPSAGYGRLMAADAQELGIPMKVVNTLPKGATAADTVGLIGADTVSLGGFVVNGAPSLGLARWCLDRSLPFYVVCDSLKLLAAPLEQRTSLPRGLERVSLRYVTAVVTESGPQPGRRPAS